MMNSAASAVYRRTSRRRSVRGGITGTRFATAVGSVTGPTSSARSIEHSPAGSRHLLLPRRAAFVCQSSPHYRAIVHLSRVSADLPGPCEPVERPTKVSRNPFLISHRFPRTGKSVEYQVATSSHGLALVIGWWLYIACRENLTTR